MTRDTYITLIARTPTDEPDQYGNPVYIEEKRRVPAQWDGVKRSEFYQAAAVGLKPEMVFRIYERCYSGQRYVEHRGRRYRVLRSYPLTGERLELVVTDDLPDQESDKEAL